MIKSGMCRAQQPAEPRSNRGRCKPETAAVSAAPSRGTGKAPKGQSVDARRASCAPQRPLPVSTPLPLVSGAAGRAGSTAQGACQCPKRPPLAEPHAEVAGDYRQERGCVAPPHARNARRVDESLALAVGKKRTEGPLWSSAAKAHGDGFCGLTPIFSLGSALLRIASVAGDLARRFTLQATEVGVGGAISFNHLARRPVVPPRPAPENAHFDGIVLSWPTTVMIASTIPAAITPPSMIVAAFF